jgi:geranylgeranylglycerol-phosphate geranylgeranyltransferase
MGAVGVFIGALIGTGLDVFTPDHYFNVISAAVVAFFFMASGNILNDYFDREVDLINHPDRPIPKGEIDPENALNTAILIFIAIVLLSFFINSYSFIITIIALILMISYEITLKNRGLTGNLTISALVALLFLLGGASVNNYESVIILALLAFFATLSREIVKDIEDIEGDVTRNTLPKRIGIKNAGIIGSISLIIAISLSPLPILPDLIPFFKIATLNIYYLYVVILADIVFCATVYYTFKNPTLAQNTLKLGMVIALIAFVIGGVL